MNPFTSKTGYVAQSTENRLDMVRSFGIAQCQQALQLPHLQKTVIKAVNARLKRMQKEQNQ
ncbi:hypothetical protein [Oceanobacter kriegii]|uniref:hypothetical protein n=1 Tax=Oceanobacter kriegii TaxID=64972 RepID=UPI00040D9924|nr:hypothetical protein [Oceanobacter kriegii]